MKLFYIYTNKYILLSDILYDLALHNYVLIAPLD